MSNITKLTTKDARDLSFIKEGFVEFTGIQANTVLRECPFEGQRKVSKDHVKVLADIMMRGKWESKDKLDFAIVHGQPILINGYHRMHAQVQCGKSVLWTVVIHECESMDQVRALYYRFDTNTRIRTGVQVIDALNFAECTELSKGMADALYRSVPLLANYFSNARKDKDILAARAVDRRIAIANEYVDAAQKYEAAITGCTGAFKRKLMNGGVAAVALATFKFQPIAAAEFWSGVALNDGLKKGDPRQTLHMHLYANKIAGAGGLVNRAAFAPATAWNAFFEGRELHIIKHYEGRKIKIAGTYFDGE